VFDCETTGLDTQKDRIVELGFQRWTSEGMDKEWRSLVNPGIPIPPHVSKVHSIYDSTMLTCSRCGKMPGDHPQPGVCDEFHPIPRFAQIGKSLAKGFSDCDFAGKNVRFDLRILAAEMARAEIAWSYHTARVVDAERLEQLAEPRTLSHLHKKYTGHMHDGAHGALSDVRASTTVIVHQLQRYTALPRDLDVLHEEQWPGWLDPDGRFKYLNGVACVTFGKWAGKPMKSVDPTYWDWILSTDFPPETKALATDAKLGKFPRDKERP
jgi:DNA polymerase-3 subunit epsilon